MTDLLSRLEKGPYTDPSRALTAAEHDANIALIEQALAAAALAIPGDAQSEDAVSTLPYDVTWDPDRRFASYRVTAWGGSPAEFRIRQRAPSPAGQLILIQNHADDDTFTLRLETTAGVFEDFAMPPAMLALVVGCGDGRWRPLYLGPRRPVRAATTAPGTGNDQTAGYGPGTVWTNTATGEVWVCRAATAGAPVWQKIHPAAGTGGVEVREEGGVVTVAGALDFVGAAVTATNQGGTPPVVRVAIDAAGSAVPSPVGVVDGKVLKTQGGAYVHGDDLTAPPGSGNLPTLVGTYGGSTAGANNAAALAAVPAGTSVWLTAGTYTVSSNCTVLGVLHFMSGARLLITGSAVVTLGAGSAIVAGDYQIVDNGSTGTLSNQGCRGPANAMWFPGLTAGQRDLGKQIHNAGMWGWWHIVVPPARDHVIRTTVNVPFASLIDFGPMQYPYFILCKTSNKPVFEMVNHPLAGFANASRLAQIRGGCFTGDSVNTPSCFLLMGRPESHNTQCGDTVPLANVFVRGSWGYGIVINVCAEVNTFTTCYLHMEGKGDSPWGGDRACVMMLSRDYLGLPFTYNAVRVGAPGSPSEDFSRSFSANTFLECDIRASGAPCFYFRGQIEDTTIQGGYLTCSATAIIQCRNGDNLPVSRLTIRPGGRVETQGAALGVPLVLVDACELRGLTIEPIGLFIGSFGGGAHADYVPVLRTVNGGVINFLHWVDQGYMPWFANRIIDCPTGALGWNVDIKDSAGGNREINLGSGPVTDSLIICRGGRPTVSTGTKTRSKLLTDMSTL